MITARHAESPLAPVCANGANYPESLIRCFDFCLSESSFLPGFYGFCTAT